MEFDELYQLGLVVWVVVNFINDNRHDRRELRGIKRPRVARGIAGLGSIEIGVPRCQANNLGGEVATLNA